jgi:MurNAc alpha-1-phosphate uridylyltransferase
MKAMILAAGVGSRLGDLTTGTPKCLMPINGSTTILEHVIINLRRFGVTEAAINLHHLPDKITEQLSRNSNFGLNKLHLSYESTLLDTGGGLKRVADLFRGERAFFVHNADIYCEYDLGVLVEQHHKKNGVATLGVMRRESKRGLYFDAENVLTGWSDEAKGLPHPNNHGESLLAFSGISVCSEELFSFMDSRERFSIIESFLSAARKTSRVFGIEIPNNSWIDIGTPDKLEELRRRLHRD